MTSLSAVLTYFYICFSTLELTTYVLYLELYFHYYRQGRSNIVLLRQIGAFIRQFSLHFLVLQKSVAEKKGTI